VAAWERLQTRAVAIVVDGDTISRIADVAVEEHKVYMLNGVLSQLQLNYERRTLMYRTSRNQR